MNTSSEGSPYPPEAQGGAAGKASGGREAGHTGVTRVIYRADALVAQPGKAAATEDERLAFLLLQSLNYAVLKRVAAGEYTLFGTPPAFYRDFFPSVDGAPTTAPWDSSPMLEFFLAEAEEFFAMDRVGSVTTGFWEEDGLTPDNTALKATALNLGEAKLIIVRLLEDEYADRVDILRKARIQLHENRELANDLSVFKEKSRIDGLTCIFNKATFTELLHDEIKRSQIMDYPLIMLVMDIDNFKKVNDTYGHLVGDTVLQGMGATLKQSLRRNDIVARYGGEEFAVLISQAPLEEATVIAEKIRANLAAMTIPNAPRITVSIGCSEYRPGETPEAFFARTDANLYIAKKQGKNRVAVG